MTKYIILGIATIVAVAVVVYLHGRKDRSRPKKPSASVVLLLSQPLRLDDTSIRSALSKGFSADFSTNTDSRFVLPVVDGAQYMVKNMDAMFILHNAPSPYFPDPDAIARTIEDDDLLAKNVRDHAAWLSFDVLSSERPLAEQYDLIGPVLSELAPEHTIALFVVEKRDLMRFDSERKDQLRGPKTLDRLGCE